MKKRKFTFVSLLTIFYLPGNRRRFRDCRAGAVLDDKKSKINAPCNVYNIFVVLAARFLESGRGIWADWMNSVHKFSLYQLAME